MNLMKTYIQVPEFKRSDSVQITLDHDFNVPDIKPDMERIIQEKGALKIQEIKPMRDKCLIRGELEFAVLYSGEDTKGLLHSMEGTIAFEEIVNMDGLQEQDLVRVEWDMEDLRVGCIHSRKINVRSIIILHLNAVRFSEEEVATAIESHDQLWAKNKSIHWNPCYLRKKDQIRVRETVQIPQNRPNMLDIFWHQERIESLDIKLQDGYMSVYGQMMIFILYRDEMMENTVNDLELTVPIDSRFELPNVTQEMIADAKIDLDRMTIDVRNDSDGESRVVSMDAVIDVDIQVYREETLELLQDVYSPNVHCIIDSKRLKLEHLTLKNKSLYPIRERIHLNRNDVRMLQICHTDANVKRDRLEVTDQGILIEGVVYLTILYISADDRQPLNSTKTVVPFSYIIETEGVEVKDDYDVQLRIEQLNTTMTDSDEIEVKMTISLDASIYKYIDTDVVCQVFEEPLDYDKIESMPGIVGHVVMPEDTLWNLAKKYDANPKDLIEMNGLTGEELLPGMSVLIMKNMEIFK